jgi:hypothetical protein
LEIWESDRSPVATGLALLAAAGVDARGLTVGAFDARLLRLRCDFFGRTMSASATCPSCGDRLDLQFDTASLFESEHAPAAGDLEVEVDGYQVSFHVPRANDAADAALCSDAIEARRVLLNRSVTKARRHGEDVSADDLPESVCRAIGERMDVEDPEGNAVLAVSCPCCAHAWEAQLDVPAYLLREINTWALRILSEVHVLASRYGWSERRILALSARRRRLYLQMGDE